MNSTLTPEIIVERIAHFGPLKAGAHKPNGEACIMEVAAFVAGEPWSDHPECVCPVLGAFLRAWNDALPDDDRDRLLRPLIPQLLNTKGSVSLERRRSLMAADWFIRTHTPAWLRLAGLTAHADALAALPEITGMAQFSALRGPIGAAAWAAARAAAGAALEPTRSELQQSALALVERMIAASEPR
jgi:hypothetical protein